MESLYSYLVFNDESEQRMEHGGLVLRHCLWDLKREKKTVNNLIAPVSILRKTVLGNFFVAKRLGAQNGGGGIRTPVSPFW